MQVSKAGLSFQSRKIILVIAIFLMIISLSRPVMNKIEHNLKQEVNAIVIAIDVSKSMKAKDLFPSRLEMAKLKLLKIIENSKHNAIGVVLFAKSSFILSPITQDFNSLKFIVNNFDSGINFDNGSNIYSVLEASNKLFTNYKHKNIILLTDGGNNTSFEKEIKYLKDNKLNVYTIALASNKPTPIPSKNGFLTNSQGEIITLAKNENIKSLNFASKGAYVNYTLNDSDIKEVLNDIFTNIKKDEIKSKKFEIYTELFYYPLALSLFLLLIAFSSIPRKAVIILCLFVFNGNNLEANILEFMNIKKANQAYTNKEFKEAKNLYKNLEKNNESKYNEANSAYKSKNYTEALKIYQDIDSSQNKDLEYKKQHNIGNTYVNLNKLKEAKNSYESALKIKEDKQTRENLSLVNKELEKEEKKKKKKDDKNKEKNDKNKDKNKKKNKDKNKKEDKKSENKESQKSNDKKGEDKKQKDKKIKENKENSKKNKEKGKKEDNKESSMKQEQISDLEEKKWLKKIGNDKVPILLRKVKSSNTQDDSATPW